MPSQHELGKDLEVSLDSDGSDASETESEDPWGPMMEASQKVTVDKKVRMSLNGESGGQMKHAQAIKDAGGVSLNPKDGNDTSKDQEWKIDTSVKALRTDKYVLITTVLWLGPKILLFAGPMLLFHFVPVGLCRCYSGRFRDGTDRIERNFGYYMLFQLVTLLSLPAIVLICASVILDYIMYYVFSLPFCLVTCRWSQACKGFEKIRPYRNGPSILLRLPDLFTAITGQCSRQSLGEPLWMVSCMWLLMPWLKYYVNCNPWIYDLDHRLCQQISTTMADLGEPYECADEARRIISRTRQRKLRRDVIDLWSFVPHYPYPPPWRRWALGLQAGGAGYPGKFTLIVHTTHAIEEVQGSTEQFVLSNSCAEPIYRVMLWYSNPFHFLTGWVEASVSTGAPSQLVKVHGGEHPMWLVSANTPLTAGRDSFTGSGMIDAFFDYWLPVFVHGMRWFITARKFRDVDGMDPNEADTKAKRYADSKYMEVKSEDGISRPYEDKMGLDKYDQEENLIKSALTEMKKAGDSKVYKAQHAMAGTVDKITSRKDARQMEVAKPSASRASLS